MYIHVFTDVHVYICKYKYIYIYAHISHISFFLGLGGRVGIPLRPGSCSPSGHTRRYVYTCVYVNIIYIYTCMYYIRCNERLIESKCKLRRPESMPTSVKPVPETYASQLRPSSCVSLPLDTKACTESTLTETLHRDRQVSQVCSGTYIDLATRSSELVRS